MKNTFSLFTITIFLCLSINVISVFGEGTSQTKSSPYGVCAHLAGGPEYDAMPKNLELMRQAKIRWIRCDFSAWDVEGPKGTWKFEHIDRLLDQCDKYDIKVLPILNHPHSYASPTYEKTEEWLIYVEKIVSRYKNRIRHWEVWNEPNLHGFGDGKVQGKNYARTLIATYKKIKEIDPELVVLYAGLAHIPLDFVEQSFEAGCAEFFDIMNVHPYRRGFTSMGELEKYEAEVVKLRALMEKFGVGDKPIWFTEMGWPTPTETYYVSRGILSATKKILDPEKKVWKIAVLTDDNYPSSTAASFDALKGICPEGYEPVEIKLTDLVGIAPKRFDALVFPPSENYPSPYHDDIRNFVTNGGTLFLLGGVPMYYQMNFEDDTDLEKAKRTSQPLIRGKVFPGSHDQRPALRVDWRASWADPDKRAPEEAAVVLPVENKEYMQKYIDEKALPKHVWRFLGNRFLKEGDRLIPLLMAEKGDYCEPCVAVYDFNSDMTGAVVVSTLNIEHDANTANDQAEYLPQAILLAQRFGVEKYFWYEFQDSGNDTLEAKRERECHFGIVDKDMKPKPGYTAYATLTEICPEGSKIDSELPWKHGDVAMVSWTRPDGRKGWTLWSPGGKRKASVIIDGEVQSASDHLGNKLSLAKTPTSLSLDRGPIYLIGPNKVVLAQ